MRHQQKMLRELALRSGLGQTLAEYALIIALVAIVVVAAVAGFGSGVQRNITNSDTELQRAYNQR